MSDRSRFGTHATNTGSASDALRVGVACGIGTAVERYDFFIYGTAAAVVFGPQFFPQISELAGRLAAFATFAIGFIALPLGGVVMGHFGDRLGRKSMLVWSLLLMGYGVPRDAVADFLALRVEVEGNVPADHLSRRLKHVMCGIVAAVSKTGEVRGEALGRAIARLRHRGPDAQHVWVATDRRAGLGHARLSIIDLETGAQPIANEDGPG